MSWNFWFINQVISLLFSSSENTIDHCKRDNQACVYSQSPLNQAKSTRLLCNKYLPIYVPSHAAQQQQTFLKKNHTTQNASYHWIESFHQVISVHAQ